MFDRAALPRVVPFLLYILFIVVADVLGRLGWRVDQLLWLYPVKIAVVLTALLAWRRHYTELAWRGMTPGLAALAVAAGIVVLVVWINLDHGWMKIGSSPGFDPTRDGAVDWPLALVRLAGAALVVPVMEELFWRSFLLRWIDHPDFLHSAPSSIGLRGFVVTALLFGIEHDLWLAGVVAGVVYGGLFWQKGHLWVAVIAHGVTNGVLGIWIITTKQWTYW
jgi:CAAX prenyl protease-like protein